MAGNPLLSLLPPGTLEQLITRVTFTSNVAPPVVVEKPLGGPSRVAPILAQVAPQVTIEVQGLKDPITLAPYGAPIEGRYQVVDTALAVGGLFVVTLAVLGVVGVVRGARGGNLGGWHRRARRRRAR